MKKLGTVVAVLVLAAVSAFGLVACGSGGDETGGGKDGGILNATYASFPEMDPHLSYSAEGWNAVGEVYIPLLTLKHAEGAEGSELEPGLAEKMPEISNGGKTYTLFLRDGLKFSDGTPVEASDFAYSIERMFKLNSPGSPFYSTIVGAEKFAETKSGGIPGIKTDDATGEIRIDLEKPRGTFSNELAMLFAAVLPSGTPVKDLSADPPPGTGPYVITETQPGRGWEYERNPYWAKANSKAMPDYPTGSVDGAKITVVRNPQTQVNGVEQGRYDWMENPPPADRYAQVKEKYEGSQFKVYSTISTYYFWMNMSQPPFDDLEVRQAINYAIDSAALERIYAGQIKATHQILPPGMPGYEQFDLYPHDMAKAEKLIEEASPSDMDVTVWTNNESPNNEAAEYYEGVLQDLGFETTLKIVNADNFLSTVSNQSTPNLDTGWFNWFEDYPHPNDFFQPLLSGESIAPTGNLNLSHTDDPDLNEEIVKLSEQQLGPEQEEAYAELDKRFMELAPWAPFGTRTLSTFVSDEIELDSVIANPTFSQYLTSFEFK